MCQIDSCDHNSIGILSAAIKRVKNISKDLGLKGDDMGKIVFLDVQPEVKAEIEKNNHKDQFVLMTLVEFKGEGHVVGEK